MSNKLVLEENRYNWDGFVKQPTISFRLSEKEGITPNETKVAQLIGAIPFLAKSNNPERKAINHLSTYLAAARGSKVLSRHTVENDNDILTRLEEINTFTSGDPNIIEKSMKLLALNMVHDYLRDMEEDRLNKKYNPLNSGVWNYQEIVDQLITDINSIECKEMDEFFSTSDGVFSQWGGLGNGWF